MSNHFHLITTLSLNNYTVSIYTIETTMYQAVSAEYLKSISDDLNLKTTPRQIVEALENLPEIHKIEIFNLENELILISSTLLDNIN